MTNRKSLPTFNDMTETNPPVDHVTLIYDGECPVCTAYSCNVDAGPAQLRRINARSGNVEVQKAIDAGVDLDDGMVVLHQGKLYHGADAMHRMAMLSPKSGLRNRLNRMMFGNLAIARATYPALRSGRNALLRLLGRQKIGASKKLS
jgi:predicted DCC family thiol-disulfide oxidoreductase YuxK